MQDLNSNSTLRNTVDLSLILAKTDDKILNIKITSFLFLAVHQTNLSTHFLFLGTQ